jgi:MFS family permease
VAKVRELVMGAGGTAAVLSPRHGLVLEAVESLSDDGTVTIFGQADGPLASYRRTVEITAREGGQYGVRQVVELKVGLPWWSWLLALPLRFWLGNVERDGQADRRAGRQFPWWAPPQRLGRRPAVVMATLAAVVSVQGFLAALLPETLTYAASEMNVSTFGQGVVFASVELSALPALLALIVADRRGRRSVVLWATAGAAVLSELGAFSPSVTWLTVTQVAAGALVAAAGIAAIVVAVEEVPAGCRAWAVGVLGMAAGFGGGGPLLLLPLAGTGPGGWRWLYWVSLLTLPVIAVSAQYLPESRRWAGTRVTSRGEPGGRGAAGGGGFPEGAGPSGHGLEAAVGPAVPGLVGPSGRPGQSRPGQTRRGAPRPVWTRSALSRLGTPGSRLALVCVGAVLFAVFAAPASQFQTEFLRQQRHYSAFSISVLQQVAGTVGALGVLVGGRLADTHGRRPIAVTCVAGATATVIWSYLAHGWLMWCAATLGQFFLYATAPVLGVYGAELFATSTRARSAGLVAASAAIGAVCGLLAAGALDAHIGTLAPALGVLAVGPLVLVVLLIVAYPETAGVPLEDLAPGPGDTSAVFGHPPSPAAT